MPNLKVLGGLVGGVFLLLCAALLAVWLLVNPNHYKGRIAAAVKDSTGRDLKLPGDIKLSLFPWVALELGPASLGNPPGFGEEPFLSIAHASLRLRLLPLLHQQLEVSRIEVDGLNLHLLKGGDGRGNWRSADLKSGPSLPAGTEHVNAARSLKSLADIRVRNGRVSYQNIVIENLDLETGSPSQGGDVPVSATFDLNPGSPGEQITVNAKFDVNEGSAGGDIRLAAVNLNGTANRPGDARPAHWEWTAPLMNLDVTQQSLEAAAFAFTYSNAHLTGSIVAKNILDQASVAGSMTLMPLVLHEFAPRLRFTLPTTKDPKALAQLSGAANVAYESNTLRLTKLQARLDDTQLEGTLSYLMGETPTLQFDLAADQIDIDRYRGSGERSADLGSNPPNAAGDRAKSLEAAGTLVVASAKFSGMDFSNLHLTVASKGRLTRLFPAEAEIDGGRYSGDITLDDRGAVRIVSVNEHLTGVDLTRLLAKETHKRHLSGRATLSLKGTARGATGDALLKTLSGRLEADLADGAFEGIDLGYDVNRAEALIDRSTVPRDDTGRTTFDQFKFSAQITNGVAETQDLTISSQALRVTGQGTANLSTKAINLQLLASLLKTPAATLIDVPVKLTGTYADPQVKADVSSVAKDQLKQKLRDVLKKNGLDGLFGK
jgi:AsmA protein